MIWKGNGEIRMEKGEPAFRSCWNCNAAHRHLKKVNVLHLCIECGKYWVFDRFFSDFRNDAEVDNFFRGRGMKEGDSTKTIDAGYRVTLIKIRRKNDGKK